MKSPRKTGYCEAYKRTLLFFILSINNGDFGSKETFFSVLQDCQLKHTNP